MKQELGAQTDWTAPTEAQVLAAIDATWPAAEVVEAEGWRLRRGDSGGKRVSAATALAPGASVAAAEKRMAVWDQHPLFMIRSQDTALDADLAARGFRAVDPTILYAGPTTLAVTTAEGARPIEASFPLAVMQRLWAEGGIGPGRLAVMARTEGPRCYILARAGDHPAGVGFVAVGDGIAMLHAVEVAPKFRRKGIGRTIAAAALRWAEDRGARTLALATTQENSAANGLYRKLGLVLVGGYHYRIGPGV